MKLYSTNDESNIVDFSEAVLRSLPVDNGLYMPLKLSPLPESFWQNFELFSFEEISFQVAKHLLGQCISKEDLKNIIYEAINFPAPVVNIHDNIYTLELFHGPTLAFKDFGARFMSRIMKYYKESGSKLTILVATSGDTGGAVASGFLNVEGVEVVILFPKEKVSPLQQKQLTTLGNNITAVEIDGTFDDCQAIVKRAFLDKEMNSKFNLSSANSINISRLIPQSFYYFNAVKQIGLDKEVTFVVPSGNFGNITAGILGQQIGLKVKHFVAATNVNDIVPSYIKSGKYLPKPSIATLSNAMDVGNPSNFPRLKNLYGSTWNIIKEKMRGYSYTDHQTELAMKQVYEQYNYVLDPHGAVGYLASLDYLKETSHKGPIMFLETAHPSKFITTVEKAINKQIEVPERLNVLKDRKEIYTSLNKEYDEFKSWMTREMI